MTTRKLEALRNLAERPGTEAEGRVARAKLARAEAKGGVDTQKSDPWRGIPSVCDCGARIPHGLRCVNTLEHERIRAEIRRRFPRGAQVYYNRWAYPPNCTARVTGYPATWNWIRVKFDKPNCYRSIPIYSAAGWHLSTVPLSAAEMKPLRGGMEKFETQVKTAVDELLDKLWGVDYRKARRTEENRAV